VVAVRAITERRESKPRQQIERKMAPTMSTARSARSETNGGRCRRERERSRRHRDLPELELLRVGDGDDGRRP
jgi:hypothetical protein